MSLLKMKIKLPKLLLMSIRKRKPECRETNSAKCSKGKRWLKTKNFLPKHIGDVFSQALTTNKKSQEILNPFEEGNHDKIDHTTKELLEGQGIQMVGHLQIAPDDRDIPGRRKLFGQRSLQQSVHAGKRLSFLNLFGKNIYRRTMFYITKRKANRTKQTNTSRSKRFGNIFVGSVATSIDLSGKQKKSKHLARIPRRRSSSHKKGKHEKFTLKKVMQQGEEESETEEEEEEEGRGIELCKKKILMGEKCRPLNKSGTLQYDENGILLPEEP